MQKKKANVFVTTFIALLISFTTINYAYAKNNGTVDNWGVTITNDAKEINDTHKIKFKVENNKDVVPGKIAPGMKAIAEIEINLEKAKGYVDIETKIDDSKLSNVFKINTKLDEKIISNGKATAIKSGSIKKLQLELIWDGNDTIDTKIGVNTENIEIPIEVKVLQHI